MANCKGLGGEGSSAAVLSHVLAVDYISEDCTIISTISIAPKFHNDDRRRKRALDSS